MARISGINVKVSLPASFTTAASQAGTLPLLVPKGALIIAAGHCWKGTDPTGLITAADNRGTSYTLVETAASFSWSSGTSRGFIAYGITGSAGSCTVTISCPLSSIGFGIAEINEANASPLDVDGGESNATSTAASDGITTVADNAVVFGLLVVTVPNGGDRTMTNGAGNTTVFKNVTCGVTGPFALSWRRLAAHGATTISWTTENIAWAVKTLSIKGG